jgi:hypothetical protein
MAAVRDTYQWALRLRKGRVSARSATSCGAALLLGESKKAWAAVLARSAPSPRTPFLTVLPRIDRDERRLQERRKYRRFTRSFGVLDEGSVRHRDLYGQVSRAVRATLGGEVARLPIFPTPLGPWPKEPLGGGAKAS